MSTPNFTRSIQENRRAAALPFLVAHRGINRANIPCNTLTAFSVALDQGADVIELDVSKSRDGQFFVFHPGMEPVFLQGGKSIADMDAKEIENTPLLNADHVPTHYRVPRLADAFALLKDRVYINVDKYWTDVEGITREIYRAGVEKQVIVKTYAVPQAIEQVERYAPELMFMQLVRDKDTTTEQLLQSKVNFIGNEILVGEESSPLVRPEYLQGLHDKGLLLWGNAIVYDERDVISAHHTDDSAYCISKEHGWGWFADKGFDFIQTDWLLPCREYLQQRRKQG